MIPEIEAFLSWLRRKSPKSSTAVHYGSDLKLFFAWLGKSYQDVKVQDIDAFIEHCQSEGHAIATVNRRLCALRSFYHFLSIQSENAPRNPVIPRRHFIRRGQVLPRDVEDALLQQLFAVITHPRDRAMFLLMLRCGLRVGEVRNLSLRDLYLEPLSGSLPRLWLHGKGNKQRVVYLSPQAAAALQNWLANRPIFAEEAVFVNRFGRRLTVTGIQDRLAKYCRKAGLWVTCHQFRHTFGRHLTEAHVPVTTIQRLLGHRWLKSTEVYLHISDPQVQADYEAAMQRIEQRLDIAPEAEHEANDEVVKVQTRAKVLELADRLAQPELAREERLRIAAQLPYLFGFDGEQPPPRKDRDASARQNMLANAGHFSPMTNQALSP